MTIDKSLNQKLKIIMKDWKIERLVKVGGTWTFIVAIGGTLYKFVGPELSVFISWIQAFLGIK